jgi:transposase
MYYIGLDAHKQYTTIAVLDSRSGNMTVHKRVANTAEAFAAALAGLDGPLHGIVESGRSTWALHDRVCHLFTSLRICDALELKHLRPPRGATTDPRVARDLAEILASGHAPKPLWVPDADTRINRTLTRGTIRLSQAMNRTINSIRAFCANAGQECPFTSLHGTGAKAWLAEVELPDGIRTMLDLYLANLAQLEALHKQAMKYLRQRAAADPRAQRLMTIPGVGPFTALCILAELGDLHRFTTRRAVVAYAGLGPQVHQSGQVNRTGPLPRTGDRWLRFALVLAAQHIANSRKLDSPLRRHGWAVALKHGKNPGKIAIARKLVLLAHHLLVHEEDYAA